MSQGPESEPQSRRATPGSARPTARRAPDWYRDSDAFLLDYAAAARYLCTTPRHVRELWAKRYLTAVKVGRHVRFTREDLDAFIAARRVKAIR